MKYVLSGKDIDLELTFDTEEEANTQLNKWLEDDKAEGLGTKESDYYIMEVKD